MEKFTTNIITPEEEKKPKKNEKGISRRKLLKGIFAAGASVLAGGAIKKASTFIDIPSDEELKKKGDIEREERRKNMEREPDVAGMHLNNRYEGYTDLESFLKDYPHIEAQPEELKKVRRYFEKN